MPLLRAQIPLSSGIGSNENILDLSRFDLSYSVTRLKNNEVLPWECDMAATVLHFGQESFTALPVLRNAGYRVESCASVQQLRASLEAAGEPDAVSMTDETVSEHHDAVSVARARNSTSLILFRHTDRDWFPDVEYDPTEAEFDLIVPRAAPTAEWLRDIAEVIAQSRAIRALSHQVRQESSQIRRQSSQLRREASQLRRRSKELLAECGYELRRFQFERARSEQLQSGNVLTERPAAGERDLLLACVDCKKSFIFPAGEQVFFREKGLRDPTHCPQCRRKTRKSGRFALTTAICSECGVLTTVPFKPTQGRPVLCRACFRESLS
jgi:CxxC-x17-CxxC domain-containing protein